MEVPTRMHENAPHIIMNRVSELAQERGWTTIDQFARETGFAYTTAHALWRNRTTRIDYETLERLCAVFGVEPGDILVRVPVGSERVSV
jgi:putative transcriptional regulator